MGLVILVRADASQALGAGHVMRCLTLAAVLGRQGARVHFVCRDHPGHLGARIQKAGFECHMLACSADTTLGAPWVQDAEETGALVQSLKADWVIVDHYDLDARWEAQMVALGCRVIVIDDLTDRSHECDVLINQNLGAVAADYVDLVPEGVTVLAGADYAMLRPEFAELRPVSLAQRTGAAKAVQNMLVSMGGADQPNATGWVLDLLTSCELNDNWSVTVVMGGQAPHLETIRTQFARLPFPATLIVDTPDMAQLMVEADLAIGAAGSTSWERCCLGLPCLMVVLADNQKPSAKALADAGAVTLLDMTSSLNAVQLINKTIGNRLFLQTMSENAAAIIDGEGTSRVQGQLL